MMAYLRIGALLIVEDDKLVGIFSERDALTRGKLGKHWLMTICPIVEIG